jgi:uncharacterized lipoprotein YbaY
MGGARFGWLASLLLAGCPHTAPTGAPPLAGTLTLTVDPDRPLAAGETVALHATLTNGSPLAGAAVLTWTLEPGLTISAGAPRVDGEIAAGGKLESTITVVAPNDNRVRRIDLSARVSAGDQMAWATRTIDANAGGGLHSDNQSSPTLTGRVNTALDSNARFKHGGDVTLTISATTLKAHPRFELLLLLPPEMTVTAGSTTMTPIAVAAGESHTLTATVHIADGATGSLLVQGAARYGRPGEGDYGGGAVVDLEDGP